MYVLLIITNDKHDNLYKIHEKRLIGVKIYLNFIIKTVSVHVFPLYINSKKAIKDKEIFLFSIIEVSYLTKTLKLIILMTLCYYDNNIYVSYGTFRFILLNYSKKLF